MRYYDTNITALEAWRLAQRLYGVHVAKAFGISEADLKLVAAAKPSELDEWSKIASPLVRPRRGLLYALHQDREDQIFGYIADTRTGFAGPELSEACLKLNAFVLKQWHNAIVAGADLARFGLTDEDIQALRWGASQDFSDWGGIPLAIAVPREQLIQALAEKNQGTLYALIGPWRTAQ